MFRKLFRFIFNHDQLDSLRYKIHDAEKEIDIYRDRVQQLEAEVREYKGYKLKYKVAQMLVDDDPAIEELLDCYKETQRQKNTNQTLAMDIMRAREEQLAMAAQGQAFGSASLAAGLGVSACASPKNFDAALGRKIARENALAITKLEEAMHRLNDRTQNRKDRGVEGTNTV